MEDREAMTHSPFYFHREASASSTLHAPPGFMPMSNPNLHPLSNSSHPGIASSPTMQPPIPPHPQEFSHEIHMGIASSPTMQPSIPPHPSPEVKKKRGRPRKYVPDLELSSMPCDPIAPKRPKGRPPGTGRKQRLANLGGLVNSSAGFALAAHVISVQPGEDIVSKVLSFSQQMPRAVFLASGTGTVSRLTILEAGSAALSFQGQYEIINLGGSYLVNEEGAPKSRIGGISVFLSRPDNSVLAGVVGTLIASSLVQVFVCSFVYGSAKAKAIKQENRSKEYNKKKNKTNNMETSPTSQPSPPPAATESEAEAAQTPPGFSAPGWSGSGGGGATDQLTQETLTNSLD